MCCFLSLLARRRSSGGSSIEWVQPVLVESVAEVWKGDDTNTNTNVNVESLPDCDKAKSGSTATTTTTTSSASSSLPADIPSPDPNDNAPAEHSATPPLDSDPWASRTVTAAPANNPPSSFLESDAGTDTDVDADTDADADADVDSEAAAAEEAQSTQGVRVHSLLSTSSTLATQLHWSVVGNGVTAALTGSPCRFAVGFGGFGWTIQQAQTWVTNTVAATNIGREFGVGNFFASRGPADPMYNGREISTSHIVNHLKGIEGRCGGSAGLIIAFGHSSGTYVANDFLNQLAAASPHWTGRTVGGEDTRRGEERGTDATHTMHTH